MQRAPATIVRCALALGSVAWLACASPASETPAPAPAATPPAAESEVGGRAVSDTGRLVGRLQPETGPIEIGAFQTWMIELRDRNGAAVTGAAISIAGGMPAHGHGLPTEPRVTEELGGGRYRIEGMKLNMVGAWVIEVFVATPALRDRLRFDLAIDY